MPFRRLAIRGTFERGGVLGDISTTRTGKQLVARKRSELSPGEDRPVSPECHARRLMKVASSIVS
jgi:hypothetical protein